MRALHSPTLAFRGRFITDPGITCHPRLVHATRRSAGAKHMSQKKFCLCPCTSCMVGGQGGSFRAAHTCRCTCIRNTPRDMLRAGSGPASNHLTRTPNKGPSYVPQGIMPIFASSNVAEAAAIGSTGYQCQEYV